METSTLIVLAVWAAAYLVATLGSGPFVRSLLRWAGAGEIPTDEVNPGRVIGKLEDVVVVSFVAVGAYTALALVFSAKGIVRAQTGKEQPSYYILGTLANFVWALHVAMAARVLTGYF